MTASSDRPSDAHEPGEDCVYLVGHTPLDQYLDFMHAEAFGASRSDRAALAADWRAANDRRRALEEAERRWLQTPPLHAEPDRRVLPLPPEMQPLLSTLNAHPVFRRAFGTVPARVALVELDALAVYQRTVNLEHVRRLRARLGASPSPRDVFDFCLPTDHPAGDLPPFRVRPLGDDEYVFTCESTDLRFLEHVTLRPEQLSAYDAPGPVAGVIGVVVGFGSNFLNVIAAEGRLVLNNGNHRAYALRELGVTHAPCVVQEVTRREELKVVGGGRLRRDPDRYLRGPRPPMLKDFFDPLVSRRVRLVKKTRHVRVRFTVEEESV
jgi:hypothetical protein